MLNITNFQTVTPTRVVDEAENTRVPITAIDVVAFLDEPEVIVRGVLADAHAKRYAQSGQLFTRRGSDLQDGDEVPLPQGTFGVIGGAQFDINHPMTGMDFGWVKYTIRRGG